MPENIDLRCDECGQGMVIQMVDTYNLNRPTFCPICGTPSLVRSKTQIVREGHYYRVDAKCFDRINPELVALLYQQWFIYDKREDPEVELPARFIDYLKEQLSI